MSVLWQRPGTLRAHILNSWPRKLLLAVFRSRPSTMTQWYAARHALVGAKTLLSQGAA